MLGNMLSIAFFNFFGLINRTANYFLEQTGSTPYIFPLYLLQAIFLPLQGFGNALVYGKLVPRLYNVCGSRLRVRTSATSPSRRSAFPGRVMQQLSFHEVEPQLLDDQDTFHAGTPGCFSGKRISIRVPPGELSHVICPPSVSLRLSMLERPLPALTRLRSKP